LGGKPRNIRRTASEARELILDAAEIELQENGPDALRLQRLARVVGVSHPAILHHFGSRTGLIEAVVERASRTLTAEIMTALQTQPIELDNSAALLDRIFAVFSDRGRARTMAWLFLTRGDDAPLDPGSYILAIASAVHRQRENRHGPRARSFEDTLHTVLLASLAIIGNAVAGTPLRRSAGLTADTDVGRFIAWLAQLLHEHLDRPRPPAHP